MNDKRNAFFAEIAGKRVTVVGIGISNIPLIEMLVKHGAAVTACDRKDEAALGETAEKLRRLGVTLRLGADYLENIEADILFRTPGIRPDHPAFVRAREKGTRITSEMEVFFELCPARIFAVTGSDGKSTTTTIIHEFLKAEGYRTHLGGNLGWPLLPEIESIGEDDMCVVELSSFQLFDMERSPAVAVITNLSPNHLDVHRSMEEYIAAKKNIFLHQHAGDRLVLNYDNDITRGFAPEAEARGSKITFFRMNGDEDGYCYRDGAIFRRGQRFLEREDILLPGDHNIENYMAALAAVEGFVSDEAIRRVAAAFGGVAHRQELVRVLDGVRYYNDSIASSPTRTHACLVAFGQKIILIAGGYDKKIPFDGLGRDIVEHVKVLILCGHTSDKIEQAVRAVPEFDEQELPIVRCADFREAVTAAHHAAKSGDVVALSPACASFDLFRNFEERGNTFRELVNAL